MCVQRGGGGGGRVNVLARDNNIAYECILVYGLTNSGGGGGGGGGGGESQCAPLCMHTAW